MPIKFDYKSSTLSKNIDKMATKIGAAVLMYASTKAQKLESYMKANRPWTDRTGLAKQRLSASVSQPDSNTVRITLSHGVDYGIWLELANEGNYAIIKPTIELKSPEVISELNGIMNKIKL